MARPINLFYSWQSDRDGKVCRHFLEKALSIAVGLLASDGIEVLIDADTRSVPGTPPINATILRKIESCDIFFGDMTFVAATDGGKLTPNPNVMGEYGYALHALGYERILLAMNTAFGPPGDLPFDLRHHRFPLQYEAAPDIQNAARRDLRSEFGQKLAAAILPIAKASRSSAQRFDAGAATRAQEWANEQRGAFLLGSVPAVVSRPRVSILLAPLAAVGAPPLSPRVVAPAVELFRPPGYSRAFQGADERMWWANSPPRDVAGKPNREVDWLFKIARPGALQFAVCLGRLIDDDPSISVDGLRVEAWIVRMTEALLRQAEVLGLAGPAIVNVDLDGMDNVEVLAGRLPSIRVRRENIFLSGLPVGGEKSSIGTQMRGVLDDFWLV